jgi:hypothetical protein
MWRIGMPSSSSASSNENEQLVHDLAVVPDPVARHVGADVEIGAQRRDERAAHVGHADDRARLRIELAEAVEGAGIFGRQDRQIALDEAWSHAGGGGDQSPAVGEPSLAARKGVGRFSLLRCHQNSHVIDLPRNSTKTSQHQPCYKV